MTSYRLEPAQKDVFAVHQVVYSQTDLEMWFDWEARLDDTTFTEQCYWIMEDDTRIGGVILLDNRTIMYPFMIPPFSDRNRLWDILLVCCPEARHVNGALEADVRNLLSHGYM